MRRERLDELLVPWPGYGSLADASQALEFEPAESAARFDHGFPPGLRSAWALASLERVRGGRAGTGCTAAPRRWPPGWPTASPSAGSRSARAGARRWWRGSSRRGPDAEVARLAEAGFVVRSIPALGVIRASVGAWSSEEELSGWSSLAAA